MKTIPALTGLAFLVLAFAAGADDATPAAKADAAKSSDQKSQQQNSSLKNQASEKYDTKLPIEISSDNLEVLQNENRAIFNGNVIAVQGKIRLTSDIMIVHYKQKGTDAKPGQPAPPPPKPDAAAPAADTSEMGAITLIEVEGHVFSATPEESARGDKGHYQVAEKMLYLSGDNVILTRGKNIMRGTDLVYNLETGRSVLTNKGAAVTGPNGGRVHGVFVPNSDEDQGKTKDKGKDADKDKTKTDATDKSKIKVVVPADTPAPATPGGVVAAPAALPDASITKQ